MLKIDFDKQINECMNKNLDAVNSDKWRNKYHIMAPIGWINDPNGLCEFNGEYHCYYQYSPLTPMGGLKFWGHAVSKDLANWEDKGVALYPDIAEDRDGVCYYQYSPLTPMGGLKFWGHAVSKDLANWEDKGVALYPDIAEDRDGVYSGSAFVKDDTIYFFYTGNVKHQGEHDYILTGREQNVILVTSKDGINFSEKKVLLRNTDFPEDMSLHVRDPKVWEEDGVYYMVLGARTNDDKGCILLYKSSDLYNWKFHSVPAGKLNNMGYMWECPDTFKLGNNDVLMFSPQGVEAEVPAGKLNNMGYMWECPDTFKLGNNDVLMFSPQGVEAEGYKYNNVYQCGYAVGNFINDKKELKLGEFVEIDRGFDFYAPQTFEDSKGRRIVIGWMGVPDAIEHKNPTIDNFWQHQLTIPRELVLNDSKVYQVPVVELEKLRKGSSIKKEVYLNEEVTLDIFESNTFELNMSFKEYNEFEIELREDCKLSFKNELFKLELGKSGYGRDMRAVEIEVVDSIRIFSDNSSLEIFLNNGEEVFTTRIYNDSIDTLLKLRGNGTVKIERWNL